MSSTNDNTHPEFAAPNFTQTPNEFFDEVMPEIESMAELKVTLAVIRQTFGWHKEEDRLSLTQLVEKTGMHKETVSVGVQAALKRGYIGRRKQGRGYVYGLRVKGRNIRPTTSQEFRPTKESSKESVVDTDVSTSGSKDSAKVIGLEKHVTDKLYAALDRAGYTLDNSDYGYHLGRAKKMLEKMNPTDEELEQLPASCVKHFEIYSKTDAMAALRYHRQQKARQKHLAENDEPVQVRNPNKPRPAIWYASLYEADYDVVNGWIKEGLGHAEIEKRLESGAVA